jgi:hypothetical protein
VYLVGKVGESKGRVVSVAHLAPFIQRRDDLRTQPNANDVAVGQEPDENEREVNDYVIDDQQEEAEAVEENEQRDNEDEQANETAAVPARASTRPQRNVRKPAWLRGYVQGNDSE